MSVISFLPEKAQLPTILVVFCLLIWFYATEKPRTEKRNLNQIPFDAEVVRAKKICTNAGRCIQEVSLTANDRKYILNARNGPWLSVGDIVKIIKVYEPDYFKGKRHHRNREQSHHYEIWKEAT